MCRVTNFRPYNACRIDPTTSSRGSLYVCRVDPAHSRLPALHAGLTPPTLGTSHEYKCMVNPTHFRDFPVLTVRTYACRANPAHFRDFSHDFKPAYTKRDSDSDGEEPPKDERMECPFKGSCYRRNPKHHLEFKHSYLGKSKNSQTPRGGSKEVEV